MNDNQEKKSKVNCDDMARMDTISKIVVRSFFGAVAGLGVAWLIYVKVCLSLGAPGVLAWAAVPVCMVLAVLLGDTFWDAMKQVFSLGSWWPH